MNLATYRRPGLSVLTFAAKQDEFAEFLDATLAHVEQVVVVTVGRPPSPALAPNPKLTLLALPESPWEDAETSRRAFRAAEAVLNTQWVLYLDPQERLDATGFAKLRAALYHLGPRTAALPMPELPEASGHEPIRLWNTAWQTPFSTPHQEGVRLPRHGQMAAELLIADVPIRRTSLPNPIALPPTPLPTLPTPRQCNGPLLVVGMHRSGTSLVTRLTGFLGLELGNRLMGADKPDPSNPKGHWEHLSVVEANQAMLCDAIGANTEHEWTYPVAVTPEMLSPESKSLLTKAEGELKLLTRFAFKDPRTSLTLPIWHGLFPKAGAVLCVRDPLAVAQSLWQRDRIPLVDGVRLWHSYNQILFRAISILNLPTLVMSYERLLTDPWPEIDRLAVFAGLPTPEPATRTEIMNFMEQGLCHHTAHADLRERLQETLGSCAVQNEHDTHLAMADALETASRWAVATTTGVTAA